MPTHSAGNVAVLTFGSPASTTLSCVGTTDSGEPLTVKKMRSKGLAGLVKLVVTLATSTVVTWMVLVEVAVAFRTCERGWAPVLEKPAADSTRL